MRGPNIKYESLDPITVEQAETELASGDRSRICSGLFRAVHFIGDWRWTQDRCVELANSRDVGVRQVAATCLGEIALFFGDIEVDKVRPVLIRLLDDPGVAGYAETALEQVERIDRAG